MDSPSISEPTLNCTYRAHKGQVNYVTFTIDASKMATCSNDNDIIYWQLVAGSDVHRSYRLTGHKDVVHCVDFSPNGSYLVSCSRDHSVCLWRVVNDKPCQEPIVYNAHCNTIRCVSVSPSTASSIDGGDYFATASDDKCVKIWSAICKNKQVNLLRGHTNWVRCCKYCPNDDKLIASCGDDSNLIVHDLRAATGFAEIKITKNSAKFTSLDWYPSNRYIIATASHDAKVRLFDLRMSKTLQYYHAHTNNVNSVHFHPSGNYLISSSDDSTSKLYDLVEGRVLFTLKGHEGPVTCSRFTSDGKIYASVGNDALVNLWNTNLLVTKGKSFDETIYESKKYSKKLSESKKLSKSRSGSLDTFDVRSIFDGINPFKSLNSGSKKDLTQAFALGRIVDQLDIIAQSLCNLEKRVAVIESKLDILP